MEETNEVDQKIIACPACASDAVYRYGHSREGKQRYICLICKRQFVPERSRAEVTDRPVCDLCGRHMHLYKREKDYLRFRCSGYPVCHNFTKVTNKGGN